MRVVVSDRHGHTDQWRKIPEQLITHATVSLRTLPVELRNQMTVRDGRRNTNVVQEAKIEQESRLCPRPSLGLSAFGGHDSDALAVSDVVDADQVERI